jgi:hypothetical protein
MWVTEETKNAKLPMAHNFIKNQGVPTQYETHLKMTITTSLFKLAAHTMIKL